jgi:tRNA(adenine34) deaminase
MDYEYFMSEALREARFAYDRGDLPVGAILTVGRKIVARAGNSARTAHNPLLHAETVLLYNHGGIIKSNKDVENIVFTSFEPCFNCVGSATVAKVQKIVYACPDPIGGAAHMNLRDFPPWFRENRPKIEQGPLVEESYALLVKYMKEHDWDDFLPAFIKAHDSGWRLSSNV